MLYEFGVMSNKWSLESTNTDVAFMTMVMLIGDSTIPISIFKPNEKVIIGKEILDMDNLEEFITTNKEKLKRCRDTIIKLV